MRTLAGNLPGVKLFRDRVAISFVIDHRLCKQQQIFRGGARYKERTYLSMRAAWPMRSESPSRAWDRSSRNRSSTATLRTSCGRRCGQSWCAHVHAQTTCWGGGDEMRTCERVVSNLECPLAAV